MPASRAPLSRRQRGVSLLEALVGFLIFTMGVLGLVALQASMSRAQMQSLLRAEAGLLAEELLGVMGSDSQANLASYTGNACAGYARCAEWLTKLGERLPDGQATVVFNSVTGELDVAVSWRDPDASRHQVQVNATVALQ